MAESRWPMSRRAVLRGVGASLALPWLEAMTPVVASGRPNRPPLRMAWIYHPIGVSAPGWRGPAAEGAQFELPETLAGLTPVKNQLIVIDGLDRPSVPNDHLTAVSHWLSSARPGRKDRFGFGTDLSIDQLLAPRLSEGAPLRSLELSCDSRGRSDGGMHASFVSWQAPGVPTGVETNPRQAWARMFGDPERDRRRQSVLDLVADDARQLRSNLGRTDQRRLDEYLQSVQALERRIAAFEREGGVRAIPGRNAPTQTPSSLTEYVGIMADLLVLALETDRTRVVTLMLGAEGDFTYSRRPSDFGIDTAPLADRVPARYLNEGHHGCTHSQPNSTPVLLAIDRWHVRHLESILRKLQNVREGDGTLLDSCIISYGSYNGSGNDERGAPGHSNNNVPCLLAGKGTGLLRSTGRRIRCANGTPLGNLWLTIAQMIGLDRREFGLSTSAIAGLG